MPEKLIIPTAEPFLFCSGKIGAVLIHGFTGTPKEMRLMGEALRAVGISALGVRLAGHATQPDDMRRTRWQDWLASVEDGVHLLASQCEEVFYIGLSLGGILALTTAARIPPAGVIAMSTPTAIDQRAKFAHLFSPIIRWVKKGAESQEKSTVPHRHVDYPAYPTRSLAELYKLIQVMHTDLVHIKCPVLLINSNDDPVVPKEHAHLLEESLVNARVERRPLESSWHVITESPERGVAFDMAIEFMQRNSAH